MSKNTFIISLILFLLFLVPLNVSALDDDYKDIVAPIANKSVDDQKITVYLFHGQECPHCAEEKEFLESLENNYKDKVNFVFYEVWHDEQNAQIMTEVKNTLNVNQNSVPFTVIGNKYFIGYSQTISDSIKNTIDNYLNDDQNNQSVNIPILGKIDMKSVSIPLVAIILGFVDGFNPCAMWVLLFLINMLLGMKNKKRMWLFGLIFLFTSGLVYFLSMLGISLILDATSIIWLRTLIAIVALIFGIINLKSYIQERKDTGCKVVNSKKRKKILETINKFTHEKNLILALIGVLLLAVSVNLIELSCSLGFPMIFTEILSLNNITGISRILYLILYIIFYLIDDLVVFLIAMISLRVSGISTKYNKLTHLIGGILMIIMGLLLIIKPEWLMFNF